MRGKHWRRQIQRNQNRHSVPQTWWFSKFFLLRRKLKFPLVWNRKKFVIQSTFEILNNLSFWASSCLQEDSSETMREYN